MSRAAVPYALLLTLVAASTASAQTGQLAVGLKAGTLGVGAEASVGLTRHLAIRSGVSRFHLTRDQGIEGINYRLTPRLQSVTALLDLHPFAGAFRMSGGVVLNRNEGELAARLNQGDDVSIGNHAYASSDVLSLDGSIGFRRTAPYAGIGFDNSVRTKGRVALSLDLGVMFHGHPQASLTGHTRLTGSDLAAFDEDVRLEAAEIQDRLDHLPRVIDVYPVVAMGIKVRV